MDLLVPVNGLGTLCAISANTHALLQDRDGSACSVLAGYPPPSPDQLRAILTTGHQR